MPGISYSISNSAVVLPGLVLSGSRLQDDLGCNGSQLGVPCRVPTAVRRGQRSPTPSDQLPRSSGCQSVAVLMALCEQIQDVTPTFVSFSLVDHTRRVEQGQVRPCSQDDRVFLGEPIQQSERCILVESQFDGYFQGDSSGEAFRTKVRSEGRAILKG